MKVLNLVVIILVLFFVSCQNMSMKETESAPKTEECQKAKDGLFVHVSKGYNNPQKVLMALSLSVKMAEDKDVALFFDIEGVKLLTRTSEDIKMDNFMGMHEALDKLIEMNVLIMACPMCLRKAGIAPEDLREGVIVAEKDKFFDFTKGRILSMDY